MNDQIKVCVLFATIALLCGCNKVTDLSHTPPYNEIIGKKFILQQDLYLFEPVNNRGDTFIGSFENESLLPKEVKTKNINKNFGNIKILGVANKKSVLIIFKIEKIKNIETSYYVYWAKLYSDEQKVMLVDVTFLVDYLKNPLTASNWSDPPLFKPEDAIPDPKDGIWWK